MREKSKISEDKPNESGKAKLGQKSNMNSRKAKQDKPLGEIVYPQTFSQSSAVGAASVPSIICNDNKIM